MKLSSQDSHRFLRIHSNEMKVFMFTKENTLKIALFFLALIATVMAITLTIGFGGNKSLDKGSRWISLGMDEIKSNEQLNEEQALKINSHLKELNDQEELRTNEDFHNTFIEEIRTENYPESAILSVEKTHIRVSSHLNYHDGYWVTKVKLPNTIFKGTVINDMHIDPFTKRVTVYAQLQVLGKTVSPAQVGPGEYATDNDGNKTAHHPNSVYLNGSGQELSESDGTGEWWVKHSWILDGEGYMNWELKPEEDYGEGTWVDGTLLDDGITMKIGTLSDTEKPLGFNTRKPIFKDNKLSYEVVRWEYENNESEPNEVFTLEWNYKTKKSAFDGLRRKPLGE